MFVVVVVKVVVVVVVVGGIAVVVTTAFVITFGEPMVAGISVSASVIGGIVTSPPVVNITLGATVVGAAVVGSAVVGSAVVGTARKSSQNVVFTCGTYPVVTMISV